MDRSWENQALNDDDTTNHWLVRRPVHAQFFRTTRSPIDFGFGILGGLRLMFNNTSTESSQVLAVKTCNKRKK